MLEGMGWQHGEGLGKDGAGRVEPVSANIAVRHALILVFFCGGSIVRLLSVSIWKEADSGKIGLGFLSPGCLGGYGG